ncbi:MAG: glycogen/starch/alpha-glucan phosphorylase [Candidatus Yanofskybacteria bacterium]|nr:glycogen/starch/alpha-glucan phosphorylase [Candidatus Yanofskybacteria bacterium]
MSLEQPKSEIKPETKIESEKRLSFFERIGRPELKEKLTPETPWAYFTMELYGSGIRGGGGLGILAADTLEVKKKEQVPAVFITPFYTKERAQGFKKFEQRIKLTNVKPEKRGFKPTGWSVTVREVAGGRPDFTELGVYQKQEGCVTLLTITEKNFGALYQGENNSDHRLYQEISLGFGGWQAMRKMGMEPTVRQLNESATVFSALACLDEKVRVVGDFEQALRAVKDGTIYTNHTLVQAAEAEFTLDQFDRFVMPNIQSDTVKKWLRGLFRDGRVKLSTLAIELAGKKNGVSLIHAREAGKTYKDIHGNNVEFEGITNGIALDRWGDRELLAYYREHGIIDEFDLVLDDFKEKIQSMDAQKLEEIKERDRTIARDVLKKHKNQYGEPVVVPQEAKIYDWKRRIAEYKRPGMVFERPDELAGILEERDAYLVMAGEAHSADKPMQEELKRIFKVIDANPILKKRVHFVKNYNEVLAKALAQGADVALNTPRVRIEEGERRGERISTEACGTSWEKDILGNTILISTPDGGAADLEVLAEQAKTEKEESFLEISGQNFNEEVESLYGQMRHAADLLDDKAKKIEYLKRQLAAYLPIISGARMEVDYLNSAA